MFLRISGIGKPRISYAPPNEGAGAGGSTEVGAPAGGDTSVVPSGSPADSGSVQSQAPGSTAPSEASAGDTSSGSDFDFIRDIFGDSSQQEPVSKEAAAQQPAPSATEAQPAQATAPAQPAQQQPPPAQLEATAATAQQAAPLQQPGEVPRFDPADPFTLARGLVEHEAAAIEHLANTVFRLEPAEVEAIESDFAGNMPKLLAKVALFGQHQLLTQLGNIVPLMMQRSSEQRKIHETNANKFYDAWPNIDRQKHGELVNQLGVRYRKMFPEATLDQMIQQLGPLVLTAIGAQPTTPAAAQPPKGNGARPPQPRGFVPAAPGAAVQIQQVPDDPFGYMGPQSAEG